MGAFLIPMLAGAAIGGLTSKNHLRGALIGGGLGALGGYGLSALGGAGGAAADAAGAASGSGLSAAEGGALNGVKSLAVPSIKSAGAFGPAGGLSTIANLQNLYKYAPLFGQRGGTLINQSDTGMPMPVASLAQNFTPSMVPQIPMPNYNPYGGRYYG